MLKPLDKVDLTSISNSELYLVGNDVEIEAIKKFGRIKGKNVVLYESLKTAFNIYKMNTYEDIKDICSELSKYVVNKIKDSITDYEEINNIMICSEVVDGIEKLFNTNIEYLSYICIDANNLDLDRCKQYEYGDEIFIMTDKIEKSSIDYVSEKCEKIKIKDKAREFSYKLCKELLEQL